MEEEQGMANLSLAELNLSNTTMNNLNQAGNMHSYLGGKALKGYKKLSATMVAEILQLDSFFQMSTTCLTQHPGC